MCKILRECSPMFSHLSVLFVALMEGAREAWVRLAAELALDGQIASASERECEVAWMPTCNDVNEGALERYCVHARNKLTTSMHVYNVMVMYSHNGTEAFMKAKFAKNNYAFIRQAARIKDTDGSERKQRDELV